MKYTFLLSAFLGLSLLACKKDNPIEGTPVEEEKTTTLIGRLQLTYDGQIYLNDTLTSSFGYRYFITNIILLGTELRNGSNSLSPAFLYNREESGSLLFTSTGSPAAYGSLTSNIGVPPSINHADPSKQPNDSPLNISNVGTMHWGWNPGYIFVKIEGKADTLNDGQDNFDRTFNFHLGGDELLRTIQFPTVKWTELSSTSFESQFTFDLKSFFDDADPIDLRKDYFTHSTQSQMPLCNRLMDKLLVAIKSVQ